MAYPIPDYNKLYIGAYHVDYAMVNNKLIKKIYRGHTDGLEMIYRFGFPPITYYPKSTLQTFTVPNGLSKVHVECVGSKGYGDVGGKGGKVTCDLTVTSGQVLYIMVGNVPPSMAMNAAIYNASDIRSIYNSNILDGSSLSSRIVVAGGGGNMGWGAFSSNRAGGAGGGPKAGQAQGSCASGGQGGTQSAGGIGSRHVWGTFLGGRAGKDGTFGLGGCAGLFMGGAGWYGGGEGTQMDIKKQGVNAAGGGGGSSYPAEDNALCTNVVHEQGVNNGPGYVTISMLD